METTLLIDDLRQNTRRYAYILLPIVAILIWLASLQDVDLLTMNDLGLISVLPAWVYLALGLLTISFCMVLRRSRFRAMGVLLHILVLILMLYGVAPFLEGAPRTPTAWKLLGLVDKVMDTGAVDPRQDAFQNWPGFFILAAFVTQVMGLETPLLLATWAPVFLSLLYLGPLYLIFRAGSGDRRVRWLAIWFFYLANWIGQDYLSPQGFNYFFFLVIMAVLLNWFKYAPEQPDWFFERWMRRPFLSRFLAVARSLVDQVRQPDQPSLPWQRVGLLAVVVVLFSVVVPSHQLTPFATLAAVTALVLVKRLTPRTLPVLMGLIAITWVSYMAITYVRGHFETISSPVGSLGSNLNANVTNRFRGSTEHIFILQLRIFFSWFIWLLAFGGVLHRIKHNQLDLTFLILAGVPFGLIAMQAYGGELLMRVYLFSLPFMAFFMASLFYPARAVGRSVGSSTALGLLSILLMISFLFTRYGNERMDYFTPREIAAMDYLYDVARPGAQILAGTQTLPWRYDEYDTYAYRGVERIVRTNDIDALVRLMTDRKHSITYLVLTRSQRSSARLFLGWAPGTWERFEIALSDSGRFETIFDNGDARILVLRGSNREP